jgi:hypothetical protein
MNTMKLKLLTHACLFLLFMAYLTACKKEEVKPVTEEATVITPEAPKSITVTYKIYAVSGNFNVTYSAPNAAGNKLESTTVAINKMQHDIEFVWKTGNRFKVQASNVNPSTKEVTVEVYINGILYNSAIANSPNAVAAAEAFVY